MAGWIPAAAAPCVLVNERTGGVVAAHVELAVTRRARRRGLLGRPALAETAALVLAPCWAIHTAGMRFPIDVVFVDRTGRAMRLVHGLRSWRIAVTPGAHAAIELPAGSIGGLVAAGDSLRLVGLEAAC